MQQVNARIVTRNGTSSEWEEKNPVLLQGELGLENDTGLLKAGDGENPFNSLPYINTPQEKVVEIIDGALTNYIPKVSSPGEGNIPVFNTNGELVDSGVALDGSGAMTHIATETIIGGVLSSTKINQIAVQTDGTMIINGVSTSKLFNDPDEELILVAGKA